MTMTNHFNFASRPSLTLGSADTRKPRQAFNAGAGRRAEGSRIHLSGKTARDAAGFAAQKELQEKRALLESVQQRRAERQKSHIDQKAKSFQL